jgi:tetratricopeptide (TPR) repeat protein
MRPFDPSQLKPRLLFLLILFTTVPMARAQGRPESALEDTGMGGSNTIQGRIYYPGGRRLDRHVKVRLRSVHGGEQFTLTDDNGNFAFRRLRGGTYYITVEAGEEYEPVTETIDIIEPGLRRRDEWRGQTVTIQINLQPRRRPAAPIGTVDASLASVPEEALKFYRKAIELARGGDRERAVEELKRALSIDPDFMLAHNELGAQYLKLGQFERAAAEFRAALKLAPEAFAPRLNYGIALLRLKDLAGAATELELALQKNSSSAAANMYLGEALIRMGRYDQAEKYLRRAIDLNEAEAAESYRYLGALYIERQQDDLAANALDRYLRLAPKAKDADKIRQMIKQLRKQKE